MAAKISAKFMSISKQLLKDDPDFKSKLEKVMGRVADTIVKDKYVDDDGVNFSESEKKDENEEGN